MFSYNIFTSIFFFISSWLCVDDGVISLSPPPQRLLHKKGRNWEKSEMGRNMEMEKKGARGTTGRAGYGFPLSSLLHSCLSPLDRERLNEIASAEERGVISHYLLA